MKLTAVFEPSPEGGYTCFVEAIPAAISQGKTLDQAKENLLDALRLVVDARQLAEQRLSPDALRESIELAEVWSSSILSANSAWLRFWPSWSSEKPQLFFADRGVLWVLVGAEPSTALRAANRQRLP